MKSKLLLLVLLFLFPSVFWAQKAQRLDVLLKSGTVRMNSGFSNTRLKELNTVVANSKGYYSFLLQFEKVPGPAQVQKLKTMGVKLEGSVSATAYLVSAKKSLIAADLKAAGASGFYILKAADKMEPALAKNQIPARARRGNDKIELWLNYSTSLQEIEKILQTRGFEISDRRYAQQGILGVQVIQNQCDQLANIPEVSFVQFPPADDEILNDRSILHARANVLKSTAVSGGRALTGTGVVVGVGDDGATISHVDLALGNTNLSYSYNAHGVHVMATIGGKGIRYEKLEGYAPRSRIVSQVFSNILQFTPEFIEQYGMGITNNSYGNLTSDCDKFGVYDLYSRLVDQQLLTFPELMHVFAAGNSGNIICPNSEFSYGSVLGGYQSSKNAIVVGNTTDLGEIARSSSKGPVSDGRIKPDISAMGTSVFSASLSNGYGLNSGTSMAAPAVSGGLALLYERYKQLHSGENPRGDLMKVLLLNGATDKGNAGPDYQYGYGWLNLLRSITMLEQQHYWNDSVAQGERKTQIIKVPDNLNAAELKVMVYWHDPAAPGIAEQTLQHDLDLIIQTPSGTIKRPLILTGNKLQASTPAIEGIDRVNNVEQVVIKDPVPGDYIVTISGHRISNASSQAYVVAYNLSSNELQLTSPVGGEKLLPNDSIYISWENFSNNTSTVDIDYSLDDGISWTPIATAVDARSSMKIWHIPPTAASVKSRVRVRRTGDAIAQISEPFTILNTPVVSLAALQCPTYINLSWLKMPEADEYEVMLSSGGEMESIGITSDTNFLIRDLNQSIVYFVSVRAIKDNKAGLRSLAIVRTPSLGNCAGDISNKDLQAVSIPTPISGRVGTGRALPGSSIVRLVFRSIDNLPIVGTVPVGYQISNGPVVAAITGNLNLNFGSSVNYAFPIPANLSASGIYNIKAWTALPEDPSKRNDTVHLTVKNLENPVLDLSTPYLQDFESVPEFTTTGSLYGLPGLDAFDFFSSTVNGRIRSYLTEGIAHSGRKALTMDVDRFANAGNTDSLTGTFNLSMYNAASDDIRLDWFFKHHGQLAHAANRVWIRGNDQSPWLLATTLDTLLDLPGEYIKMPSLELSRILQRAGQNFSSSFQVKWGQWGRLNATDNKGGSGYTIDDIRLYKVQNDIQLKEIVGPIIASCGLSNATPVEIKVRNSAYEAINNITVKYRVNGGSVVSETIPVINAEEEINYTFNQKFNFSNFEQYQLETWLEYAGDNFKENDTLRSIVRNTPVINAFPYLQDFENDEHHWYAAGRNSSWEFGTPASIKINSAASGKNAWKTSLAGNYKDGEYSYLYSPCFDIAQMNKPMLSFSAAMDIEDCGQTSLCDAAWVEYSLNGKEWLRLSTFGEGKNGYNRNYPTGAVWSIQNYSYWHVSSLPLPAGNHTIRLRFVMKSDPFVSREGLAIDDIHLFDKSGPIFISSNNSSNKITKPVNNNNWIAFDQAGELMAAVNPMGKNLGDVSVQTFFNKGQVRDTAESYILDRNWVLQNGSNRLTDSADIRLYFTDAEADSLRKAKNCASCPTPDYVYQLGVASYIDKNKERENGSVADNEDGNWYWRGSDELKFVPYDSGYYVQLRVNKLAEFWLTQKKLGETATPEFQLQHFTAKAISDSKVELSWRVNKEISIDKYVLELARGNAALINQQVEILTSIPSNGNSTVAVEYSYTDEESGMQGVRYYRLVTEDVEGNKVYSDWQPVWFSHEMDWQVYPNPGIGTVWLMHQAAQGEKVNVIVYNIDGRRLVQQQWSASGFVQRTELQGIPSLASGLYLIEVQCAGLKQVFRFVKAQ